jgi:hypothetical protein
MSKMSKSKKANKYLFVITIIVIFLALANLAVTFYKIGGLQKMTGKATYGTANLSISSYATVNFTRYILNWGAGVVWTNESYNATIASNGTVSHGNWTLIEQGLVLQNDGNCNVRLNLTTTQSAATLIGGGGPLFRLNVSNNESGSCITGIAPAWEDATAAEQPGCGNFTFADTHDTLDIDVLIRIPADAVAGARGSVITATAYVID